MKLDVFRLGITFAIIGAGIVFLAGVANLIWSGYAVAFLKIIDSLYPGYHFGEWGFLGVIVGTLYALIDGFIVGIVFGWIYNLTLKGKKA